MWNGDRLQLRQVGGIGGGIGTEKNIHANKAEVANIKWPRNIKSATSKKKSGFKMYINYQTRVRL